MKIGEHLLEADKRLLEMKETMTYKAIGQELGLPARHISKRIKKIRERINTDLVRWLMEADLPKKHHWCAIEVYVRGRSQRDAAFALGIPLHEVRHCIGQVRFYYARTRRDGKKPCAHCGKA